MSTRLYANIHQNFDNSGSVSLFIFGAPGETVEIRSQSGFSASGIIGEDGSVSIGIPQSLAMSGTGINDQGLQITSDADVSAYISNRQPQTTDLSIVFDETSLGDRYVIASAADAISDGGQFSAQALEDGTELTFTLPDGQTATVTLDAGQSFKFSTTDSFDNSSLGISVPTAFDLTGTVIAATAPVAVFSGHSCTNVGLGFCDHIVEQMPSVDALSQSYVVSEAFSELGIGNNLIRVVAPDDDIEVRIDGELVATLSQGEFYEFTLSEPAQQIQTSLPALIAQYLQGSTTAGEGDPALSFVPGTDTWLSSYIVATPSGAEALAQNLVNIVVPTAAVSSLQINGSTVNENAFAEVAGTDLSVGNIPIDPGIVRVEASESFQLSLFGFDAFDSFLTFGGANFASGLSNVPPEPADDLFLIDERTTLNGDLFADNGDGPDTDRDGDALIVTAVNGVESNVGTTLALASGAELRISANGAFFYDGNLTDDLDKGTTVSDTLSYTVSDGVATAQATVTVAVSGVDAAPVALDDRFFTDQDAPLALSFGDLLANDSDLDGNLIPSVSSVADAENGFVRILNGEVIFTPDPGFFGEASFTYQIEDETGLSDSGTARVTVDELVLSSGLELTLPRLLSVGETGTALLTSTVLGGSGNASLPSLVALTAERAVFEDPLTGVLSETVFILTEGTPGEEVIEIDIRGSAGPRANFNAVAQAADPEAVTDLAARFVAFQPDFLEPSVVARIEGNITALFGTTIASLTSSLIPYAEQLASFGLDSSTATGALAFAFEAAGDYGSIQERGTLGSLGQGWASLADLGLKIDGTSVRMSGLADIDALRALSVDAAALYTVSSAAGRSVSLGGDPLALTQPARPQFEQARDGSFVTTSAFDGTLRATEDGYALVLSGGEVLVFDADGAFLWMEMTDGLRVTAAYDGAGNIVELSGPSGAGLSFDRRGDDKVTRIEDADGVAATLSYDAAGRLETVTRPDGQSNFTYNADGDLISATAPGGIAAEFAYDGFGRLDSALYGGGAQSEDIAYDEAGGITITDGAGRVTDLDLLPGSIVGRITDGEGSASEIFYDSAGELAGVRAPDGTETLFEFDNQDRLSKITDANGAELLFTYDGAAGEPGSFTDAGGNTRSFDYDAGGRITEATWPDGTTLQFEYDDQGNLSGYTNRRGDDVTYIYDDRGRLLSESDSSVGPISYSYDDRGRLILATTDQGTTTLAYDDADRVTQIDYPTGKSLFYSYNEAGLRASMSDGAGYELFYDYDALGRLAGLRDGDGLLVTYGFDAAGNLIREENGNGTVTTFDYDSAGRLTRIENLAPDASINSFNAYTYDSAGQRITHESQDGTWSYGYDAAGQLTSAEFVSSNAEIANKSIAYEYDLAGNRTRVVEDGVETLYEANALNQYTRVGDESFTYDDDGNMTSRIDSDGTSTYSYDLDNRLTSVTQSDGTVLEFEYDLFGNRVSKTVDGAETEYLVDPFGLGDVVSEFEAGARSASYAHGLGLAAGEIGGQLAFYDADAVGSVTTVTGAAGGIENAYAYTPFGTELFEVEGIANAFEFNGVLGVAEDAEDLTFMRARSYSDTLGRFLSEEPKWANGDIFNLYQFGLNDPVTFSDPEGEVAQFYYAGLLAAYLINKSLDIALNVQETAEAIDDVANNRPGSRERLDEKFEETRNDLFNPIPNLPKVVKKQITDSKGLNEAIDDGLGQILDDVTEPTKEILEDLANNEPDGPTPPEPDPESPAGPPVPKRKPEFDPELPERDPPFDKDNPDDTDSGRTGPADGDTRNYGDPHLITFDRTGYSFQALGEFTMVIGDGFEMQVRMEAITDVASVNTAVAMLVGDNIIGVYADETIPLVANGTAIFLAQDESVAVGDFTLYRTTRGDLDDPADAEYIVTAGSGNGFYVRVFDGALNILPFVSDDAPVAGLLGNLDADRSNDFALRDGTVLPQPLAQTILYGEYADSWRIDGASSLFLYRDGESTETFTDRSFPPNIVTLDDLDPVARAQAEAIAEAAGLVPGTFIFETTVIDIVLTENTAFAEAIADVPDFAPDDAPGDIEAVEINEAPVAGQDSADVGEGGTVDIAVLDNDSDPEGDGLFLIDASDANGGTAEIVGNLVRFTPASGFSGPTVVTYQLGDTAGNVVSGSILVEVIADSGGPTATDDGGAGFFASEDTPSMTASVLDNDSGSDGVLRVDSFDTTGTLGLLIDNGDGTFTYDPNGAFEAVAAGELATDRFTYRARDDGGISAPATVEITVDGRNDAPVASDDNDDLTTPEETSITIDVLANDSDVDASDVLRIQSVASSPFGVAEIVNDRVVFTPNAGVTGAVGFDYTISDGDLSATATVTVFVGTDAFDPPMKLVGTKENDDLVGGSNDDVFLLRIGDDTATGEGGADDFILDSRSIQNGDTYTIRDFDTSEGDRVVFRFFDQRREIRSDEDLEFYIENGFATVIAEDGNEKTVVFQNLDLNFGSTAETFIGTKGDDNFDGMNGNDSFLIRGGSDTVTGGLNADTFIFDGRYVGSDSLHTITDLDFAEGDALTFRFWNANDRRITVSSEEDLGALEDFTWAELENTSLGTLLTLTNEANESLQVQFI
ncbi:MAG: Ig-like domain-containing protein [Rhodobacteraceae bacterium]|nr:Ig-like domain-containing protein [Paracoccaceae bacterium]